MSHSSKKKPPSRVRTDLETVELPAELWSAIVGLLTFKTASRLALACKHLNGCVYDMMQIVDTHAASQQQINLTKLLARIATDIPPPILGQPATPDSCKPSSSKSKKSKKSKLIVFPTAASAATRPASTEGTQLVALRHLILDVRRINTNKMEPEVLFQHVFRLGVRLTVLRLENVSVTPKLSKSPFAVLDIFQGIGTYCLELRELYIRESKLRLKPAESKKHLGEATDRCISALATLTKLEKLHLRGLFSITEQCLPYLTTLVNLKELNTHYSPFVSERIDALTRHLSGLQSLSFQHDLESPMRFTSEVSPRARTDISRFNHLQKLWHLHLQHCSAIVFPKPSLDPSRNVLLRLNSLDLHACLTLSDEDVENYIAPLSQLISLRLRWCPRISRLDGVARLTNLRKLDLSGLMTVAKAQEIGKLTSLKKLKILELFSFSSGIDDATLKVIGHIRSVQHLDIADEMRRASRSISPKGLAYLAGLRSLESINITGHCRDNDKHLYEKVLRSLNPKIKIYHQFGRSIDVMAHKVWVAVRLRRSGL